MARGPQTLPASDPTPTDQVIIDIAAGAPEVVLTENEAVLAHRAAPGVDPWAVLDRLTRVLESSKSSDSNSSDRALLAEALNRVADATQSSARMQADATDRVALETKRAHRPSNEVVPGISVFNRRGNLLDDYRKPRLRCLMMIPWLAEDDSCTREEVELLNLLQPGEYQIKRVDRTFIKVSVSVEYKPDGETPSRLLLTHDTGFANDNFRLLPGMSDYLRFILSQHKDDHTRARAAAVLSDEEEEAFIALDAKDPDRLTVSQ